MKKTAYPAKRSMNLYYRPDRTTKPATIALYVLFILVCLLGLGKFLVYDLWAETAEARRALAAAEDQLDGVMLELTDYSEVWERYSRYSATEEERDLIDRMEVLALLDEAIGAGVKNFAFVSVLKASKGRHVPILGAKAKLEEELIKSGVLVVSSAPIMCMYPFVQKYFNQGVMIGAVKG